MAGEGLDLNLVEPDEIPLPPEKVRMREILATPLADGRRVRISVRMTPFLERPTLGLAILAPGGEILSETTVVEVDQATLELTMHLRAEPQEGRYAVRGELSYGGEAPQDVRESHFDLGGS